MKAKKFITVLIITVLTVIIIPALIVFIVDPIQLYHDQVTLKKTKYFKEQRHQNIGLINKYLKREEGNYTIIVGTSMSENFVPSQIQKKLNNGSKVLKLTMSGGRPLEQYTLLEKALQTGKVKRVIWDIHWYYLLSKISQKDKNHDFPYKLYSNDIFTQGYYYLFNEDYVKDSIKVFTGKVNWGKWTENLDKLNYTMDDWIKGHKFMHNHSKQNITKMDKEIKKIATNIPSLPKKYNYYATKLKYPDIDKYILPIVKKYKNVEFDIFFPPYSTYFYAKSKIDKSIRYIYARKYLVDKAKKNQNVKIFGFDNNYEIVNNIYNYKDYGHYRAEVNDYIIKSIIDKKHMLSTKNIDDYINKMIQNINNYNQVYFKDNSLQNVKLIANLDLNKLKWKTDGNIKISKNSILFSAKHIKKFAYLSSKIKTVNDVSLVKLKIQYHFNDVKMFSITLKDKKEYAHFFIQPGSDELILTKNNISKKSKKFKLSTVTEITIRVYPKNKDFIKDIEIQSIKMYKKE